MSDILTITTNNQARDVLHWFDLTPAEQKELDYLDTQERQDEASFFRYKGVVYDLGEFMRIEGAIAPHPQRPGWEKWHGYASDSFFSGVLVRYCNDHESIQVATYFS